MRSMRVDHLIVRSIVDTVQVDIRSIETRYDPVPVRCATDFLQRRIRRQVDSGKFLIERIAKVSPHRKMVEENQEVSRCRIYRNIQRISLGVEREVLLCIPVNRKLSENVAEPHPLTSNIL